MQQQIHPEGNMKLDVFYFNYHNEEMLINICGDEHNDDPECELRAKCHSAVSTFNQNQSQRLKNSRNIPVKTIPAEVSHQTVVIEI